MERFEFLFCLAMVVGLCFLLWGVIEITLIVFPV